MTIEELDPEWVLSFLIFIAAFSAGMELSQVLKPKRRTFASIKERDAFYRSRWIVFSVLGSLITVLFLTHLLIPAPA